MYMQKCLQSTPVIASLQITQTPHRSTSLRVGLKQGVFNFSQTVLLLVQQDGSHFSYQACKRGVTVGVDAFALWQMFLVNLVTPQIQQSGYKLGGSYQTYSQQVFSINTQTLLVFKVQDLVFFYQSFEAVLIPKYLQIGQYGSRNKRVQANYLFILYTLFGSLFQLSSILGLQAVTGTTDYLTKQTKEISQRYQSLLFKGFFVAFAVKLPVFPFHIWLPVVHTESPTGGSVILAAVQLKQGTYGFLRYSLVQFPQAAQLFTPFVVTLALVSVLYAAISAFSQVDLKQVIAYSSIIHMNLSQVGLFSNEVEGIKGAVYYSITHGIIASALFQLVGAQYERYHTRTVKLYGGQVQTKPLLVLKLFQFTVANISLPGTAGFAAEQKIYFSAMTYSPQVQYLTASVIVLLPLYFKLMYQRISFGAYSSYFLGVKTDLNIKEQAYKSPLVLFCLIFGFKPNLVKDTLLLPSQTLLY